MTQINKGTEGILINSIEPGDLNQNYSHDSKFTSNNNDLHLETPQSQSNNLSMISRQESNINLGKTNSMKDGTTASTLTVPTTKKLKKKRISSSSNGSKKNVLEDINNMENKEPEKALEPIMEAPPLEKIIKKDDIYEFYINDPQRNTEELMFKDNKISTTKYNAFTFLPKALLYQFMRLANVYFAFIAVIQSIPIISPLGAATAILPIVFVLCVSLIREAIEDLKRRSLDNEQNSNEVEIYRNGNWIKIKSGDLRMGEIVRVKKDGIFPSDLMLIDSNLPDGVCFIETGTLDGEKTLKIKSSPNFTKGKFAKILSLSSCTTLKNINSLQLKNSDVLSLNRKNTDNKSSGANSISRKPTLKKKKTKKKRTNDTINEDLKVINSNTNMNSVANKENIITIEGIIQCDLPNPSLYMLNGRTNMRLNGIGNEFPLDAKNLLLKGAKLRNTEWVIGIIIYTGHNCKLMKNAKDPILKMSSVEFLLNKLLVGILCVQIVLSIISSICHLAYFKRDKTKIISSSSISQQESILNTWIDYLPFNLSLDSVLSFFTYILLLNTMIPVSLIITLELVKIVQGLFIGADAESYSFNRKKYITTNSVSLNEELGMIDYIFSDKTGTLTCNKMNLKFCVIGKQCFEFIRNGFDSDEINVNKALRLKEDIIPFENYTMLKSSTIGKINIRNNDENDDNEINGNNKKLPSIKYQNYVVKSKENKNVCIYLDSTEKLIEEYWKALALCHDCSIQNGEYIGMSPDNLELVKSASLQGFKFDVSDNNTQFLLSYISPENNEKYKDQQRFGKLRQIEFSSDRKRESVIVKEGSLYKLYIKGADSIIEERLDESTPTEVLERSRYFVNLFSAQGYRTLYIAMKIFKEEEWEDFAAELEQAEMDTLHKKEKLEEIHQRIESGLTLIGSTIVEDKLQDSVPEVIKELRQADIKIWMLTGDKLSTAYNIGLSCNLINKEIKTFFVEGVEKKVDQNFNVINIEEQEEVILNFVKDYKHFQGSVENGYMKENSLKFGILVDEKALLTITNNEEIAKIFLEVAKEAVAVICCRVSPLQKSQVVKLMKNYDKSKITLAIGDGGNDVSMIMEAHIGIGIYGEEGLRAAQSSDYAIGEFKVLRRLLFFHGYLNLMRNSTMVIYFFYKNFVFTIIHFFYGFLNDFSGQTIIEDWFITLYNLLFTSIPLAARGILDITLRKEDGIIVEISIPYLYKEQRDKPIFNIKNFLLNQLKGILHAIINYFITIYVVFKEINKNGNETNLWVISAVLYTNILLIVTIDLIIFTKYHTFINWILIAVLTFFLYIFFLIIVEKINIFKSSGSMNYTFKSSIVWLDIILVSGICALIDLVILCYNQLFVKSIYHQIRALTNKNDISNEAIKNYPKELRDLLLEDDTVKKKNNIKPKARVERGSIKRITHRILANDNVLNEEKDVKIFPVDNKDISNNNSSSDKKKKRIVKKKKKKIDNNLIDNKTNSIVNNHHDEIPNIKLSSNKIRDNNIDINNNDINMDINNYESTQKNWNENNFHDNIEVKKIKNNMKPFSNIRFNNRNVRNNRNDISKGQSSIQRDQTDRGLLKSNL